MKKISGFTAFVFSVLVALNAFASGDSGNSFYINSGYNAQTTTYAPVAADKGKLIDFTGSSNTTWTLTSCSTLGKFWFAYLRNNGTSNAQLLLQSSGGTIDTIAAGTGYIMYSGEVRKIFCDGTNFETQLLNGGTAVFNSSGTWQRPPGYNAFNVEIISSGGAGAARATTGNAGGGAGGVYFNYIFPASAFVAVASTETVTVGATAAGVTGNTAGTAGNASALTINGSALQVSGPTAAATAALGSAAAGGTYQQAVSLSFGGTTYWNSSAVSFVGQGGQIGVTTGGDVTAGNVPEINTSGQGFTLYGGGAGGACSSTAGGVRSGTASGTGGAGGAGGLNTGGNGTNGAAPGGGGGGAVQGGTSGSGAAGRVTVRGLL